ncbi:MAG: dihydroxyacetone kinase family protein [Paracoccus sp. (in: a-proteobacteria)]|uniref:dihydroxyacetone kinase family protein n=1 Tax=Paracoccus sp. TaxID=267 RepID=UPI0039E3C415
MTKIHDAPETFARQALAGFCAAYPRHVMPVANGAIRTVSPPKAKVALVVGGGSGHYPAFLGYVGYGLADAAVAGDVFASPSTNAVAAVARQAHSGAGVILGFGNYAGDVLNFTAAAQRLRDEGIDARLLAVTDDVASASLAERHKRRGVAGDVPVFKVAGAAAEEGLDLDAVHELALRANAVTVSFGVAFQGCTLPGKSEPLFSVDRGKMALGLGIHGEPGISTREMISAADLAGLLLQPLLAECPAGHSGRVAVLLNGLGTTKYEELFVLWHHLTALFDAEGLVPVAPEVGEFVTSLDMAGCSLSLMWLDEDLERLWCAAADAPAFRRGDVTHPEGGYAVGRPVSATVSAAIPQGSDASRRAGECIAGLLEGLAAALAEAEEELGAIDARAGDGDHGQGMARGSRAAADVAAMTSDAGAGAATLLAMAGDAWVDRAGGTSGALWGAALRAWGKVLTDTEALSSDRVARGARAALDAITGMGGAKVGDKTLVDALVPFVEALENGVAAGLELAAAWASAAQAADAAAVATASLTPRLGRARPLAEQSIGHPDAGAISLALCARVAAGHLAWKRQPAG